MRKSATDLAFLLVSILLVLLVSTSGSDLVEVVLASVEMVLVSVEVVSVSVQVVSDWLQVVLMTSPSHTLQLVSLTAFQPSHPGGKTLDLQSRRCSRRTC